MLSVDKITVRYGAVTAVRDFSLEVGDTETVAVLGPNGAGKSSLVRAICGFARVVSGQIMLNDVELTNRPSHHIARLGLALVPEGRQLFTTLTVKENLVLAARAVKSRYIAVDLEFVIDLFPVINQRANALASELSGGQAQMVSLARAIMQRPRLILMDEPSTGLSPLIVRQLPGLISAVRNRTGAAVLLVEQNSNMALEVASRVYVMRTGRSIHTGTAAELRANSSVVLDAYLGSAKPA